jgi:hypothetical protein
MVDSSDRGLRTVRRILDDFLELGFIALQQVVDPFCDPNIFTEGIVTGISLVLNVIVLPLYIFFLFTSLFISNSYRFVWKEGNIEYSHCLKVVIYRVMPGR